MLDFTYWFKCVYCIWHLISKYSVEVVVSQQKIIILKYIWTYRHLADGWNKKVSFHEEGFEILSWICSLQMLDWLSVADRCVLLTEIGPAQFQLVIKSSGATELCWILSSQTPSLKMGLKVKRFLSNWKHMERYVKQIGTFFDVQRLVSMPNTIEHTR